MVRRYSPTCDAANNWHKLRNMEATSIGAFHRRLLLTEEWISILACSLAGIVAQVLPPMGTPLVAVGESGWNVGDLPAELAGCFRLLWLRWCRSICWTLVDHDLRRYG